MRVRLLSVAIVATVASVHSVVLLGASDVRAILALRVNQAAVGESLVILRDGGDILVPIAMLESAGVTHLDGTREVIDGRGFISLRSLAGVVEFELDEARLELRLQAASKTYARRQLDLRSAEPAGTQHPRHASAFINYAAEWSRLGTLVASGELGVQTGTTLLTTTVSRTATGAVERGLTTATYDQTAAMRRFTFGDTTIQGGPLAGSGIVAGAGVSREFSLNPYFVRFPTPSLTGTLTTASTVDVYVNDRLVRRAELPPGTIDVTGIPALSGPGQTRLVIRDAFGRSSEITSGYYVTTAVLTRGLQDYQYVLGLRRKDSVQSGARYGEPMFSFSHRIGLTNSVTVGFRSDGDRRLVSGGPMLTARVGRFGQLELTGSLSHRATGGSAAGSAAWAYQGRRLSAGASVRAFGANYAVGRDSAATGRQRLDLSVFAGVPLGALGTIGLQYQDRQTPAAALQGSSTGRNRRTAISGSARLVSRAQMLWSAARVSDGESTRFEAYAGVSIGLGSRATAMVAARRREGETKVSVDLQRPLDVREGFGYRVRAGSGGDLREVNVQYQNRFGRYEFRQDVNSGAANTAMRVSGGMVIIGNSITLSRPVQQSYALVRVPGVAGVRVLSGNQEVGRTNSNGDLLLPTLLANYSNSLAIADQDIPIDRAVPDGERRVAPPWRGGVVVTFPSARLQAVTGRLEVRQADGVSVIPVYGVLTVTVDGTRGESPIGDAGVFFLEQAPPGEYPAVIDYRGLSCAFTLQVPALTRGFLADLGKVTCEQR